MTGPQFTQDSAISPNCWNLLRRSSGNPRISDALKNRSNRANIPAFRRFDQKRPNATEKHPDRKDAFPEHRPRIKLFVSQCLILIYSPSHPKVRFWWRRNCQSLLLPALLSARKVFRPDDSQDRTTIRRNLCGGPLACQTGLSRTNARLSCPQRRSHQHDGICTIGFGHMAGQPFATEPPHRSQRHHPTRYSHPDGHKLQVLPGRHKLGRTL